MPRRIPIKVAQDVGQKNQCQQVIILAFDGTLTHIVTWGKSVIDCEMAARGGNILKEKWGWPECNDQPSRVKKLQERVEDLELKCRELTMCLDAREAAL